MWRRTYENYVLADDYFRKHNMRNQANVIFETAKPESSMYQNIKRH